MTACSPPAWVESFFIQHPNFPSFPWKYGPSSSLFLLPVCFFLALTSFSGVTLVLFPPSRAFRFLAPKILERLRPFVLLLFCHRPSFFYKPIVPPYVRSTSVYSPHLCALFFKIRFISSVKTQKTPRRTRLGPLCLDALTEGDKPAFLSESFRDVKTIRAFLPD